MSITSKDLSTIKGSIDLLQKEAEYNNQPLVALRCQSVLSFLHDYEKQTILQTHPTKVQPGNSKEHSKAQTNFNVVDDRNSLNVLVLPTNNQPKKTTKKKKKSKKSAKTNVNKNTNADTGANLSLDPNTSSKHEFVSSVVANPKTSAPVYATPDPANGYGCLDDIPSEMFQNDEHQLPYSNIWTSEISCLFLYCLSSEHSVNISVATMLIFIQLLEYPQIAATFLQDVGDGILNTCTLQNGALSPSTRGYLNIPIDKSELGKKPSDHELNQILNRPLQSSRLTPENNNHNIGSVIRTAHALFFAHNADYSYNKKSWADLITEAVCNLYLGSSTSERIQNQIIKSLSSILSRSQIGINQRVPDHYPIINITGTTLLTIVQTLGSMLLYSEIPSTRDSAKSLLVSIIQKCSRTLASSMIRKDSLDIQQIQNSFNVFLLLVCWNYAPLSALKIEYVNETIKSISCDLTLINSFIITNKTFKICTEFYISGNNKQDDYTLPLLLLNMFLREYYQVVYKLDENNQITNKGTCDKDYVNGFRNHFEHQSKKLNFYNKNVNSEGTSASTDDATIADIISPQVPAQPENTIPKCSHFNKILDTILKFVPSIIIAYGASSYTKIFSCALDLLETCCKLDILSETALYNIIEQCYIPKITAKIAPVFPGASTSPNASPYIINNVNDDIAKNSSIAGRSGATAASSVLSLISNYKPSLNPSKSYSSAYFDQLSSWDQKIKYSQAFAIEHISKLLFIPNTLTKMLTPLEDPPKILLVNITEALCSQLKNGVGLFSEVQLLNQISIENDRKLSSQVQNGIFSENFAMAKEYVKNFTVGSAEHAISSEYSEYQRSTTFLALESIKKITKLLDTHSQRYNFSQEVKSVQASINNLGSVTSSFQHLTPPDDNQEKTFSTLELFLQKNSKLVDKFSSNLCSEAPCIKQGFKSSETSSKQGIDAEYVHKEIFQIDPKNPFIESLVAVFLLFDCNLIKRDLDEALIMLSCYYGNHAGSDFYRYYVFGYTFLQLSSISFAAGSKNITQLERVTEILPFNNSNVVSEILQDQGAMELIQLKKIHFHSLVNNHTLEKIALINSDPNDTVRSCFSSIWIPIIASVSQLFESAQTLNNNELYSSSTQKSAYQTIISKFKGSSHTDSKPSSHSIDLEDCTNPFSQHQTLSSIQGSTVSCKHAELQNYCVSKALVDSVLEILKTCIHLATVKKVKTGLQALLTTFTQLMGLSRTTKEESWKNRRVAMVLLQVYKENHNLFNASECSTVLTGISGFYFRHYNAIIAELKTNRNLQLEMLYGELLINSPLEAQDPKSSVLLHNPHREHVFLGTEFSQNVISSPDLRFQQPQTPKFFDQEQFGSVSVELAEAYKAKQHGSTKNRFHQLINSSMAKPRCSESSSYKLNYTKSINQVNSFLSSIENEIFISSKAAFPSQLDILSSLCTAAFSEIKQYQLLQLEDLQEYCPVIRLYGQNSFFDYADIENIFYLQANNSKSNKDPLFDINGGSSLDTGSGFNTDTCGDPSYFSTKQSYYNGSVGSFVAGNQLQVANDIVPGHSVCTRALFSFIDNMLSPDVSFGELICIYKIVSDPLIQIIKLALDNNQKSNEYATLNYNLNQGYEYNFGSILQINKSNKVSRVAITAIESLVRLALACLIKVDSSCKEISIDALLETLLDPIQKVATACTNLHIQHTILFLVSAIISRYYNKMDTSCATTLGILSLTVKECIKIGISQAGQLYGQNDNIFMYASNYSYNKTRPMYGHSNTMSSEAGVACLANLKEHSQSHIKNLAYCRSSISRLVTRNIIFALEILYSSKSSKDLLENNLKAYIECIGLITTAIVYTMPPPNVSKLFFTGGNLEASFLDLSEDIKCSQEPHSDEGSSYVNNRAGWSVNKELIICNDTDLFENAGIFSISKVITSLWEYSAEQLSKGQKNSKIGTAPITSSQISVPLAPLLQEIFKVAPFAIEPLLFDGKLPIYLFDKNTAPSDGTRTVITGSWNYSYNINTVEAAQYLPMWPVFNATRQMLFDVWYTSIKKISSCDAHKWIISCNFELFEIIQKLILLPESLENIECLVYPWVEVLLCWFEYLESSMESILAQETSVTIKVFKSFIDILLAYMLSLNEKMYKVGIEVFSKLLESLLAYQNNSFERQNMVNDSPCLVPQELWAHFTCAFESVVLSKCMWGSKSLDSATFSPEISQLKNLNSSNSNTDKTPTLVIDIPGIYISSLRNLKPLLKRGQFLIDMEHRSSSLLELVKFIRSMSTQGHIAVFTHLDGTGMRLLSWKWHRMLIVVQGFARAVNTLVANKSTVLESHNLLDNIEESIYSPKSYIRYASLEFAVLLENVCTFTFVESMFSLYKDSYLPENAKYINDNKISSGTPVPSTGSTTWVEGTLLETVLLVLNSYIKLLNVNQKEKLSSFGISYKHNTEYNNLQNEGSESATYQNQEITENQGSGINKYISNNGTQTEGSQSKSGLVNAENFTNFIKALETSENALMLPTSSLSRLVLKVLTELISLVDKPQAGSCTNQKGKPQTKLKSNTENTAKENRTPNTSNNRSSKEPKENLGRKTEKNTANNENQTKEQRLKKIDTFISSNHSTLVMHITDIISITDYQNIKKLGAEFIKKIAKM